MRYPSQSMQNVDTIVIPKDLHFANKNKKNSNSLLQFYLVDSCV